ncbi:response regulator [Engelhardtia mirabilis]
MNAESDGGLGLIFVVDDEPMICELAVMALGRKGYQVEVASSVPEALERFKLLSSRLAAVIVDKNLPGSNGIDLIDTFRLTVPDLPALLISGELMTGDGSFTGPTAVVGKPFRLEELSATLAEVIARRGR